MLEEQGLPSVFVASTEFVSGAETQSQLLGVTPNVVYVPHPIQDCTDAEMHELARQAVDNLLEALVQN